MKRLAMSCMFASLIALPGSGGLCSAQPPAKLSPETADLVKGNTAFALDLYGKVNQNDGNLFFSPYSISTALAMTYAGARGTTADEMARTLHFPHDQSNLPRVYADLINGINGKTAKRQFELTTANRLWGQQGYTFDPSFLKLTQEHYGAGLKEVDFAKATEQARQTINDWVTEETKQKIKELIKPRQLTNSTRLVLTNAIYFKAAWAEPFHAKATIPAEFKVTSTKAIADVPLMRRTSQTSYYDGDSVQVLALPYLKNELSMIVLLPKQVDGLAELEKSLTASPAYLANLLAKTSSTRVAVTLPKFKMTSAFQLRKELIDLGMPTAFQTGKADFSGIATREPLALGFVIHQAFVDVDEAGTEAAAATAVGSFSGAAKSLPPPEFRADHPFLFLIQENQSGSILFMGRLMNPKA